MRPSSSALTVHSAGAEIQLTSITLDNIQPTEAVVEIHATGICHTDLSCMEGKLPAEFPNVLGHEGAGVVLEVGSNVESIHPGDKVLLSYSCCGHCNNCKANQPAYCANMIALNFGGKRPDGTRTISLVNSPDKPVFSNFFGQSSFSKLAIVSGSSLVPVPPETDLPLMAPLGCGLQTGAGAILNALDMKPGGSVAIFGAGCVGMSAIMAAKLRGAAVIIAIDVQPDRLTLARELGATHVFIGTDPDLIQMIQGVCQQHVGVEYALDCTGVTPVIESMIESLCVRGKAASVGAPSPGKKAGVDVFKFMTMGKQWIGCHQGDCVAREMIPYLLERHHQGQYPLEKLIKFYDIKDFARAFQDMKDGKVLKPVLQWV